MRFVFSYFIAAVPRIKLSLNVGGTGAKAGRQGRVGQKGGREREMVCARSRAPADVPSDGDDCVVGRTALYMGGMGHSAKRASFFSRLLVSMPALVWRASEPPRVRPRRCSLRARWHSAPPLCKRQSDPATPAESQHSCQPTVKPHTLPQVWNFPLGNV